MALSHINNLKAPGPMGSKLVFTKKNWKIVEKSIYKMVKAFFYNGCLLKEINKTLHYFTSENYCICVWISLYIYIYSP